MFRVKHKGEFKKTKRILEKITSRSYIINLDSFGARGVEALIQATPILTGETASSWSYKIEESPGSIKIVWMNDELVEGVPLAVLLQYGHGTRNGGYVEGRDYINPALKAIFEQIAEDAWQELTKT